MKPFIYHCLVVLHPPVFRRQFGAGMELIFEESGAPIRLYVDLVLSLLRQWLLRRQVWIFAVALAGALIPVALGLSFLRLTSGFRAPGTISSRQPAQTVPQEAEIFMMITATVALLFISGTLALAISWFRFSHRRRA